MYDHLTLDLILESEMLNDFEFEITGANLDLNMEKICQEYFNARNLRPIKIIIDGSPFAHQNELAKMLSNFYHLHHVKNKCFMKNMSVRLKKKIEGAVDYLAKMEEISLKLNEHFDSPTMIMKTQNDINAWKEQIVEIESMFAASENPTFDEQKEFIRERLSSYACSRNQGYILSGYELNSEMASSLFLDDSSEGELNEQTKPDFVIIINRYMDIDPECLEISKKFNDDQENMDGEKCKQWTLKNY